MKKILIITNIVTASLLLLAFIRPASVFKTESGNTGPASPTSLGVNMNVARDIVANYRTRMWNGSVVENKNYKDARSVWFSLAKLKRFIADLELKAKGIPGTKSYCDLNDFDLGVRIYFCKYPIKTAWDSPLYGTYFNDHWLPKGYSGLHTVMLVPTLYNPVDSFQDRKSVV